MARNKQREQAMDSLVVARQYCFNGTCFTPLNEPWPGFLFYAAAEFTPANPFWNDFRALNEYITRTQSFLQSGSSDNEVLLYYPIFDRYAFQEKGMLEHFDALSPAFDGTHFKNAAELMLEKGYGYDFISDLQLTQTLFNGESVETVGNIYRTIIIPECKFIPVETFSHVLNLARDGATVLFFGDLPVSIAGWADKDEKATYFNTLMESIQFTQSDLPGILKAEYGNGIFLKGDDLEQLLSIAGIAREKVTDQNLSCIRRRSEDGNIYFISNPNEKPFEGWVPLQADFLSAAIFNPMKGDAGKALVKNISKSSKGAFIKLEPFESLIISTFKSKISGDKYIFYDAVTQGSNLEGTWKLEFIKGGPVIPDPIETRELSSWTEMGNEDLGNFSGSARYTPTTGRPVGKADAWILDLGKVCESANIKLNEKFLGTILGPYYRITIPESEFKEVNTLEIEVSNLIANRIAYMDRNNIPWKKLYNINMAARLKQNTINGLFDASGWKPIESGLIGPVKIIPAVKTKATKTRVR